MIIIVVVRGKARDLLEKAKESCLLAVDVYNKPKTSFKSGAYIVLMNIAWTSLFHAIFQYKKQNYYYKSKKNPRLYEKVNGRRKAWDLNKCVKTYFKNDIKEDRPIRKNIEFFIPLRNSIEHSFLPDLDDEIFGECQANLHNFEHILTREFGEEHRLNDNLIYSLKFSKTSLETENSIVSKEFKLLKKQIIEFRQSLPDEIYCNNKYKFQAYLIPVNNPNRADAAIKFVNLDDYSKEELQSWDNFLYIIREKKTPIDDLNRFRSGDVSREIKKRLSEYYGVEIKFSGFHHNKCCVEYKCRGKNKNSKNSLNTDFCIYNETFDEFIYTEKWVEYLYKKLTYKDEFLRLFPQNTKSVLNLFSPKEVVNLVKQELTNFYGHSIKFTINQHRYCLEHFHCKYLVDGSILINKKFCVKDRDNYYFTQDWVDFLIDEFTSENKFFDLF